VRVDTDQGGAKLSFEEEKKRLERAIAMKVKRVEELERKEQLAHKQFNDEEQQKVDKLIVKWREVCQTVTQDLYARCVADMPDLTIPQLLEHVQIEPQLIHYSREQHTCIYKLHWSTRERTKDLYFGLIELGRWPVAEFSQIINQCLGRTG